MLDNPSGWENTCYRVLVGRASLSRSVSESRSQLDPCESAVSSEETGDCGFLKRQKDRLIGVFAGLEETFGHPFDKVTKRQGQEGTALALPGRSPPWGGTQADRQADRVTD